MKSTIIRKVDELGTTPIELRRTLGIEEKMPEIY